MMSTRYPCVGTYVLSNLNSSAYKSIFGVHQSKHLNVIAKLEIRVYRVIPLRVPPNTSAWLVFNQMDNFNFTLTGSKTTEHFLISSTNKKGV
jgi:hypothetical protein